MRRWGRQPIPLLGKVPLVPVWQTFADTLATDDDFTYLRKTFPNLNCGEGLTDDMVVVDIAEDNLDKARELRPAAMEDWRAVVAA